MPQTITVAVKNDLPQSQEKQKTNRRSSKGVTSHWSNIATSWSLVTLPITALTVAFLVMVFQYRVTHDDIPFENLRAHTLALKDEKNVVYVDLNSSVILFVTSWASSLAPMLAGFIMALASFPIARQLSNTIRNGRTDSLPTPYQFGLTLKFLDGSSLAAIWFWMVYLISWGKTRKPQTPILIKVSNIAVLATVLGALVSAADTWLHLTTTTVPFTQASSIPNPMGYSFGLIPQCLRGNNSVAAQSEFDNGVARTCSMIFGRSAFLRDPPVTLQVMNNLSPNTTVYTHTHTQSESHGKQYAYFGVPSEKLDDNHDFTAHTYGAHTSCSLISQHCNLESVAPTVRYNCSAAFNGHISDASLHQAFFTDEKMSQSVLDYTDGPNKGTGNPFYFALASGEGSGFSSVPGGTSNPDFVKSLQGVETFVLGCRSTIYDIEYDHVDGDITRFDVRPSNTSVSNIWQSTTSNDWTNWSLSVKQAMTAALVTANTSQEFANQVALSFSKVSMAMGAQGIEKRPALATQKRNTTLVARIPLAPLVALVAVSLLFVLTGLLFTALAIWAARFEDARNIQASLGITGLVADRFEEASFKIGAKSVDEFFAEYIGKTDRRVAIDTDNEMEIYRYTTWTGTDMTDPDRGNQGARFRPAHDRRESPDSESSPERV